MIDLYRKYVFHGNLVFGIPNTLLGIAPSWLVANARLYLKKSLAGTMFKYYIKDDSKYTWLFKTFIHWYWRLLQNW
jgi:hypothetical protein